MLQLFLLGPLLMEKSQKEMTSVKKLIWKNKNLKIPDNEMKYKGSTSLSAEIMALDTPYQFFSFFFLNDELLNLISEET